MIVVCGEALFDVYAGASTPTGLALDARIGGAPFNVAVGLARLGQPAALLTAISSGFLGERLLRALHDESVHTGAVQRSPAPTTLSLVGVDAQGVPSYAFYNAGCADTLVDAAAATAALGALPAPPRVLQFGSYATVVGRTAQAQRLLVEGAQGRCLVSYDPNVRLNVEPDAAVWRAQLDWMLPRTQLLKISDEDLGLLYPGRNAEDFAAAARQAGVRVVVVTRGAQGASGWTARGERVAAAPVTVALVDTVGAGDTFQAALLCWLAEHDALDAAALDALPATALEQALAFAARAAAITCGRRGADLPRRSELNPLRRPPPAR